MSHLSTASAREAAREELGPEDVNPRVKDEVLYLQNWLSDNIEGVSDWTEAEQEYIWKQISEFCKEQT